MKAADIFNTLFSRGEIALSTLRSAALKPELIKTPKDYSVTQACELIGKGRATLRNKELDKSIQKARTIKKLKREERVYNLKEINSLRDYFGTRITRPKHSKAIIAAVVNFKGGVSKSVTSVTQAQGLAEKGYKVLLIDGDSQGSSTAVHGKNPDKDVAPNETLLNILCGTETDIRPIIQKTHWDGLDFIPGNLSLYNAEMKIPHEVMQRSQNKQDNKVPFQRLSKALEKIEDEYDLIIFDTPPSVGAVTTSILLACNAILIPVVPGIIDFSSTVQFLKMTAEVFGFMDDKSIDLIRILVTKHNHRKAANEIQEVIKQTFGNTVMTNYMIESEAIARAASSMKTLHEVEEAIGDKKSHKRAVDYASRINDELERCFRLVWEKQAQEFSSLLESDEVENGVALNE